MVGDKCPFHSFTMRVEYIMCSLLWCPSLAALPKFYQGEGYTVSSVSECKKGGETSLFDLNFAGWGQFILYPFLFSMLSMNNLR